MLEIPGLTVNIDHEYDYWWQVGEGGVNQKMTDDPDGMETKVKDKKNSQ